MAGMYEEIRMRCIECACGLEGVPLKKIPSVAGYFLAWVASDERLLMDHWSDLEGLSIKTHGRSTDGAA